MQHDNGPKVVAPETPFGGEESVVPMFTNEGMFKVALTPKETSPQDSPSSSFEHGDTSGERRVPSFSEVIRRINDEQIGFNQVVEFIRKVAERDDELGKEARRVLGEPVDA